MDRIREKSHRLSPHLYRGTQRVSFTACLQTRQDFFVSQEIVNAHAALLLRSLEETECQAEIYLFMPDHIHAIITGTSDTADAHAAMSKFKQYSGYALARSGGGIRWQKDFYDYIHRKERDLFTHMEYILKNPIRKGLCDSWQDYPYKGSTVYDLDRWPTG